MQTTIHYIFIPTNDLSEAALSAGQGWLLEPEIWFDLKHDRTGPEHSQAEVESAVWTVFLAKLVGPEPESASHKQLRMECLRLGFRGCWSVFVAPYADSVKNLLQEALEMKPFAEKAVVRSQN